MFFRAIIPRNPKVLRPRNMAQRDSSDSHWFVGRAIKTMTHRIGQTTTAASPNACAWLSMDAARKARQRGATLPNLAYPEVTPRFYYHHERSTLRTVLSSMIFVAIGATIAYSVFAFWSLL